MNVDNSFSNATHINEIDSLTFLFYLFFVGEVPPSDDRC